MKKLGTCVGYVMIGAAFFAFAGIVAALLLVSVSGRSSNTQTRNERATNRAAYLAANATVEAKATATARAGPTAFPTDFVYPTAGLRPADTDTPANTPVPTMTAVPLPTATGVPTLTPVPTATALPTATLEPTETVAPETALRLAVADIVTRQGRMERDSIVSYDAESGVLAIQFDIGAVWSISGDIPSAQHSAAEILEYLSSTDLHYNVVAIAGTYPMSDNFGNTSEPLVIIATYTRETIEKINWSGFREWNVFKIADHFEAHRDFQSARE